MTLQAPSAVETETDQVEMAALGETLQENTSKDSDTRDIECCYGSNICDSTEGRSCVSHDVECHGSERHVSSPCDMTECCVAERCDPAAAACDALSSRGHKSHDTSRESHDNMSDVELSRLTTVHHCDIDTVRGDEPWSCGVCRLATSCHDVTASTRCSDYEAASVLSDLLQLATTAIAVPCTSFSVVRNTAPSTSFGVVGTTEHAYNGSVDCGPAVQLSSTSLAATGLSLCPSLCPSASLLICLIILVRKFFYMF